MAGILQTLILKQEGKQSPLREQRRLLECLQIEHGVTLCFSVLFFGHRCHRETTQPGWQL